MTVHDCGNEWKAESITKLDNKAGSIFRRSARAKSSNNHDNKTDGQTNKFWVCNITTSVFCTQINAARTCTDWDMKIATASPEGEHVQDVTETPSASSDIRHARRFNNTAEICNLPSFACNKSNLGDHLFDSWSYFLPLFFYNCLWIHNAPCNTSGCFISIL